MRHMVNVGGMPTVLFGPEDIRTSHRPDEYVSIDDLRTTVNTLTLTVLRFCGAR
jgi:acetylornithine deacetylase